jgi:hypothetical protein
MFTSSPPVKVEPRVGEGEDPVVTIPLESHLGHVLSRVVSICN